MSIERASSQMRHWSSVGRRGNGWKVGVDIVDISWRTERFGFGFRSLS